MTVDLFLNLKVMKKQSIRTIALTFLLAAYLVYPGTLFGQDEGSGKYRIKISKEENGKRTDLDTTFRSHEEMKAFLEEHDVNIHTSGDGGDSEVFILHSMDGGDISEDLRAELEKAERDMRKAKKELKKARKELSEEDLEELIKEIEKIKVEVETETDDEGKERTKIIIGGTNDANGDVMIWNHGENSLSDEMHRHIIELEEAGDEGAVQKVIIIRTDDDKEEKIIQKKRVNLKEIRENDQPANSISEDPDKIAPEPESYRIADDHLKIFPNPSAGMLNISYEPVNNEPVSVRIIDSRGRKVAEETLDSGSLINRSYDLQSNSKGTYLVQVRQGSYWRHEKIVLK